MLLATKKHTAGQSRRYEIDYCCWLQDGRTLKGSGFSATFTAPVPADATITNVTVTEEKLFWFVTGGSVNETFTVQVQVTDTLNQTVIDTVNYVVVAP